MSISGRPSHDDLAVPATIGRLLRAQIRNIGLLLGDRSCRALALGRGGVAVTTDRALASLDLDMTVEVVR